jgi:hypothetical protein
LVVSNVGQTALSCADACRFLEILEKRRPHSGGFQTGRSRPWRNGEQGALGFPPAADAYGWVPVNKKTLETNFPGVYAVGDVNGVGTPKAGVFAEGAARVVAAAIIAQLRGGPSPEAYKGAGSCYVEFGHDQVGRVDVDFLSGPKPTGIFKEPSEALVAEKADFGSSRLQRWFGRPPVARA